MFKVAFGITGSVAELHGVGAAGCRCDGDDDHLLHRGVHHGAVYHKTCSVVDVDADVAEVLVEADVDSVVTGTCHDGVGADA